MTSVPVRRRRWRQRGSARTAVLVAALIGLWLPAGLTAQDDPLAGRPLRVIEFSGAQSLPDDTLRYYLGLELGQVYDPVALNRSIHALWDRQLVDDVEVEARPEGDGVRLHLRVTERPRLQAIEYQGLDRINRTDITDRIALDRIQVFEGSPLAPGELERLRAAIEAVYAERGFRLARASYRVETPNPGERRVIFEIDEGDKVRITEIDFEGNETFSDGRLRRAMKKTKETGLISRLRKRDIYGATTIAEDLQLVRDVYRNEGYKNVHVGEPRTELRESRSGEGDRARRRLALTIPVEEGDRWRMGSIEIEGNETYKDDQILTLFQRPSGDWLRANLIDDFVEKITEVYNNNGFIQARVQPELIERDDQVADVVIHVIEDEQYRVGRLEFDGNTKTRDKVLRREMLIQESRVFNTGALRTSLRRIGQLQYWKVDPDDPVGLDVHPEDQTVDVTVRGQEGDRTEIQFGATWSEIYGFTGNIMLRSRNFLGRGETFGVSFASGEFADSYEISYAAPWFMDRPQSISGQVFRSELDFSMFDEDIYSERIGGSFTYGRNTGVFSTAGITATYFEDQGRTVLRSVGDGEPLTLEFDRQIASLRPAFTFDNRDNPLFPTRGMRFNFGTEYTGGALGGTSNFVRPEASLSFWTPVTRQSVPTVWGAHVRAGWMREIGDGGLFWLDRFFLGGEQSLRGFRLRHILIRDEDGLPVRAEDGGYLGGERMLQFNTEFHFVLGEPFRLLAFFDAGNVWTPEDSIRLEDMRTSTGLELRVFVPILGAPLRFIWAENLDPQPFDRFESFQFSIGTTF